MCCGASPDMTVREDALLGDSLTRVGAIVGSDAAVCGNAGIGAGVG